MRKLIVMLAAFALPFLAEPATAIDTPVLLRESTNPSWAGAVEGCPLDANLTGDCANLRYYNLCSGYIWVYYMGSAGDAVGSRFDGDCVAEGRAVERVITYYRNVIPGYGFTVDVLVEADTEGDGCPDMTLAEDLDLDPALRWNCSTFNQLCIPASAQSVVVRQRHDGGCCPTFATDGAYDTSCDPLGSPRSYYYGSNGTVCQPWVGPTGRSDNFLIWTIVDHGCATSTPATTWGAIKSLYGTRD